MTKVPNKRSLTIARHRTSVSLEEEFWTALADIAKARDKSVAALVREIDQMRTARSSEESLSAAIRLYVLARVREGAS